MSTNTPDWRCSWSARSRTEARALGVNVEEAILNRATRRGMAKWEASVRSASKAQTGEEVEPALWLERATGMTLTEYVNRRRIEWAKRKLLNPQARVTEVAYDVGYQSLSQFNRSFLKYVGESPSRFREHNLKNSRLKVA